MIHANCLTKRFGPQAVLDQLTLEVAPGERVALLGLNGAGKTTLIRCLLGLADCEGTLVVSGYDVRTASRESRARVGYVPQRPPGFQGSVAEMIAFFCRLRGVDARRVVTRLDGFGFSLDDHGSKAVSALSGGMLQKVLLALALGDGAALLLLDEPTANLDPRARRDFHTALADVDPRTTVLLASHRLADVEAVADRVVVLHGGRIAFDGHLEELRAAARTTSTLWMRVAADQRAGAQALLRDRLRVVPVTANRRALGVRVEAGARAEVLRVLDDAGIRVHDLWSEAPSLSETLEQLVAAPHAAPTENGGRHVDI